jgi:MoCo/4Fe-4S cofactor protein with predicted Tat translocation signal
MSMDQCHSTLDSHPVDGHASEPSPAALKRRKAEQTEVGASTSGSARKYWRSLDDLADRAEFREFLEREFPLDASRLLESSRRSFLKVMGASLALAGAATLPGCRRPDHKIYSYSKTVPEDLIPGKAMYFATSLPLPMGRVEGVLCETHEGRPTKIEGNPLHPATQGKSSAWAQASILSLYDPDRLKDPVYASLGGEEGERARSWDDFAAWAKEHFSNYRDPAKLTPGLGAGAGLAFVVNKRRSVTRDVVRSKVQQMYPAALWCEYDPLQSDEPMQGIAAAIGRPGREVLNLDKADVVVSLERDFLHADADSLRNNRGWSSKRQVIGSGDPMSRVYCVESHYTVTGAKADHRLQMNSSMIWAFGVELARALLSDPSMNRASELRAALDKLPSMAAMFDQNVVKAAANDLLKTDGGDARAPGTTLIVAGPTQPREVHALVQTLNVLLGNVGKTVDFVATGETEAVSSLGNLGNVVDALQAGTISTIVCINVNPVFDAPGNYQFGEVFKRAKHRITLSFDNSETVEASTWKLPAAHALESWGDTEAHDGTTALIQPMIAPLYAAKTDIEVLSMIAGGDAKVDGYAMVRDAWKSRHSATKDKTDFETWWRRSLHNGVLQGSLGMMLRPEPRTDGAILRTARMFAAFKPPAVPTPDALEVVFNVGPLADGSFANNAWLQELPDPITKLVWDNVALISPKTAERWNLEQESDTVEKRHAKMIELSVGGSSVRVPAWVMPGVADNAVVLTMGNGRRVSGLVGEGTGFNVFPISGIKAANRFIATGVKLERVTSGERTHQIVSTQAHMSMEGRALVREADLPAWRRYADDPLLDLRQDKDLLKKMEVDSYGRRRDLNFAERMGELSHTPANINIYVNPQRGTKDPQNWEGARDGAPGALVDPSLAGKGAHTSAAHQNKPDVLPDFAKGPQWAMSIDLTTCTGCSACMIACQSENNIPVVGKIEVNKHREMHWIRVDRYFSSVAGNAGPSGGADPEGVMFQPVACVHCENAPCETVCPVNATVHGPEGINYMVYNRCIGTRYCANNCPYKVRRFNFFEYGTKKFNGSFLGKDTLESVGIPTPANVNLIPPRLRERVDEISKMRTNPNVTVRSRGVMEKCTYCIQRINEARVEVKLKNLDFMPDGFFQTACQAACPTDAIVFGDMLDVKTEYPVAGGGKRIGSRVHQAREHQRTYALLGYLNTRPRTTHMMAIRNPSPMLASAERKKAWENPFHHGHDDHHHGGGEHKGDGGDHGGEKHGLVAPVNAFDPVKQLGDAGYKLSLGILAT